LHPVLFPLLLLDGLHEHPDERERACLNKWPFDCRKVYFKKPKPFHVSLPAVPGMEILSSTGMRHADAAQFAASSSMGTGDLLIEKQIIAELRL